MNETQLRKALDYAISVIESYQMDLRAARGVIDVGPNVSASSGPTLAEQGFCQGTIYTGAIDMIRRIAAGEIEP